MITTSRISISDVVAMQFYWSIPVTGKSSGLDYKNSSIMGGAAGINLLLGIVRIKLLAVLIGNTGFSFLVSFKAIRGITCIIAGLEIQSSAVR